MARNRWLPVDNYDADDIRAFQALERYIQGESDAPGPQDCKRALDFVIHKAADTYGEPFVPESQRATDYLLGRRSVGLAVIKILSLKPENFDK